MLVSSSPLVLPRRRNHVQLPTGVVAVVVVRLGFQTLTLNLTRSLSASVGDERLPNCAIVIAMPTAERPRRHRFPLLALDRSKSLSLSAVVTGMALLGREAVRGTTTGRWRQCLISLSLPPLVMART